MLDVIINRHAIRIGPRFAVSFQRTLRIPDDGRTYPLPPGLGAFPLFRVEDYLDRVPSMWREQGGAFIPMYQREALWLGFEAAPWKPNAVKVAVGRVNAISGQPDDARLHAEPPDYLVCPEQPWLDGIKSGPGSIRQFVAMPLGLGYTVEASVTGAETFGGMQVTVFEPKPGTFPEQQPPKSMAGPMRMPAPQVGAPIAQPMGLSAGGVMKQKIYPDPYRIDIWDQNNYGRVVVHIVNSAQFNEITGLAAPPTPVDAKTYTDHGLPWFDLYDETKGDIAPSKPLKEVKSIAARDKERDEPAEDLPSVDVAEEQIWRLHNVPSGLDAPSSSTASNDDAHEGE
ncbi:MAG TPA: hypothetical protein VLA19_25450 [Herpetosiphonaceae bacterium]|nr:hypothetical protein [Herpetosiphonaceae bacterium]